MEKRNYKFGQKVRVNRRSGAIEGTISYIGTNIMTWRTEYDVDYIKEDGKTWTLIGVPEEAIELI